MSGPAKDIQSLSRSDGKKFSPFSPSSVWPAGATLWMGEGEWNGGRRYRWPTHWK